MVSSHSTLASTEIEEINDERDLLIIFSHENSDTIDHYLGKALDCEVVLLEDILNGKKKLPSTQIRISFYGHGSREIFGGDKKYYEAEEFASVVDEILRLNRQIQDIDLLACDVGLTDENGKSYASQVQDRLYQLKKSVNVNTFTVDDDQDVEHLFFIDGLHRTSEQEEQLEEIGIPYLKQDEYSVEIMRSSDTVLMTLYCLRDEARNEMNEYSTKLNLLDAMYEVFLKQESEDAEPFEDAEQYFNTIMKKKGYSPEMVERLIKEYNIKFSKKDEDIAISCDVLQKDNMLFRYRKDISQLSIEIEKLHVKSKNEYFKKMEDFIIALRSKGQQYKGKLCDVRARLRPVRSKVSELIGNSMFSPKSKTERKSKSIKSSICCTM